MKKGLILYFAGALTGAAAAVFALKESFEVKAEEKIKEMELEIRKAKLDLALKNKERKDEIKETYTARKQGDYINYAEIKKAKEELDKVVENALEKPVIKAEEEAAENLHPSEGPAEEPYVISPESFANEFPYFDKITLVYYEGDGTLVFEDSLEEADVNVGDDFMNHF